MCTIRWCHFMDCSPDKDLAPRACSAAGQARQTRPPELDNVAPREAKAQAAAAAAYGAEQTWFLVNGCSVAIHAEVAGAGSYRSGRRAAAGAQLPPSGIRCGDAGGPQPRPTCPALPTGCHPFWLYPELDPDFDLAHGISPTSRSRGLQQARAAGCRVAGVLLVSPTYFALHIRGTQGADLGARR
ncbi:hypothetical protein V8C86DRAFT_2432363 [Haematococcus lacustris]